MKIKETTRTCVALTLLETGLRFGLFIRMCVFFVIFIF